MSGLGEGLTEPSAMWRASNPEVVVTQMKGTKPKPLEILHLVPGVGHAQRENPIQHTPHVFRHLF